MSRKWKMALASVTAAVVVPVALVVAGNGNLLTDDVSPG
jgi:hypothetical protein